MVHVHLSEQAYAAYEVKVREVMQACRERAEWLKRGSRELFGAVLEDKVVEGLLTLAASDYKVKHLPFLGCHGDRYLLLTAQETKPHQAQAATTF